MKIFLASLGVISLVLGVIGAFLPILPTAPFILLAGVLFSRSSTRLNNWLVTHKIFGKIIHDFQNEKAISIQGKILSISMLWISNLVTIFFIIQGLVWLKVTLALITIGVTIHIVKYRTIH